MENESKWTNPIFTISIGGVVGFILMFIPIAGYVIGGLIGGYIATYYAKEKKIVYGVFAGIISVIILFIFSSSGPISYNDIFWYILGGILITILPAGIGGYIGKRID
jgi:hypothetical protein